MRSFSLDDYSDRELVAVVGDLGDDEGWVTTKAVARQVGLAPTNERSVVSRFAWMRRYGILERTTKGDRRWRLTPAGHEMVEGSALTNGLLSEIRYLDPASLVWASSVLAGRFANAPTTHATMTRREWQREIRRRGTR
jgi:hypothetical protein